MTPLCFANPSPPSGWIGDFHPQAIEHAGHTTGPPLSRGRRVTEMAEIVIDNVTKTFGSFVALTRVDLHVADGEFLALLGPSGCGKTTLLRIIAGLETQSSGNVKIGGRDVSALLPRKRGLAMVFQNYAVFPHMT